MKILICGSTGLLGTYLNISLKKNNHNIFTMGRSQECDHVVDYKDTNLISIYINKIKPDVIINLIAMTNVDECEENPEKSHYVHVEIPKVIVSSVEMINNYDPHLIHISTDQVYSGKGPHFEINPNPVNVYASTKLEGEDVFDENFSTVIRTNFFGKSLIKKRNSFTDWLFKSAKSRESITVFNDVFFNPLNIRSLCSIINSIIEQKVLGVYNVGSKGIISKADFALEFTKILGISVEHIKIGKMGDVNLKAIRPNDMTMDCSKIESKLSIELPCIKSEIESEAKEYL